MTCDNQGKILYWDLNNPRNNRLFGTHEEAVFAIFISSSDKLVASTSDDRRVKLWNLQDNTSKNIGFHQEWSWPVCISKSETFVVSGGGDS